MEVREISDNDMLTWNAFVADRGGNIYQRYEWRRILKKTYGLNSFFLATFEEGKITGVLPLTMIKSPFGRKLVSGAFSAYGGILAKNDNASDVLIEEAGRVAKRLGAGNIQIRQHTPAALPSMYLDEENVSMCLHLKDNPDDTLRAIGRTTRKQINKSLIHQFSTRIGEEYLGNFFEVYAKRMRDLGTPCHGLNYWKNILSEFPENSGVVTVWDQDKVIAGLFFFDDEHAFYDEIAVALPEYRAACAYYFLHWQAMLLALERGCRNFDFRRSQKGTGTHKFKKQWGAQEQQLYYYNSKRNSISGDKEKYKLATGMWKMLPVPLTRLAGPYLRKYLP